MFSNRLNPKKHLAQPHAAAQFPPWRSPLPEGNLESMGWLTGDLVLSRDWGNGMIVYSYYIYIYIMSHSLLLKWTFKCVHIFLFFSVWGTFFAICYILEQKPVICWILELNFSFALYIDFSMVLIDFSVVFTDFSMVFIDLPMVPMNFPVVFIDFSMVSTEFAMVSIDFSVRNMPLVKM